MVWQGIRNLLLVLLVLSIAACVSPQNGKGRVKLSAEQKIKKKERSAAVYVELGIGYLQSGQNQAARDRLQRALKIMPTYPPAHSAMGMLFQSIGQAEQAEKHYRRAVELAPGKGDMANNLAVFLCHEGKYLDAEEHFLIAINDAFYETPEYAYANAGRCLAQNGDLEKGEHYLREALKISPLNPDALISLAQIMFDGKAFFKARAFLQRHEALAALSAASTYLGFQIESALGDKKAARDYASVLETRFPDSRERKAILGG